MMLGFGSPVLLKNINGMHRELLSMKIKCSLRSPWGDIHHHVQQCACTCSGLDHHRGLAAPAPPPLLHPHLLNQNCFLHGNDVLLGSPFHIRCRMDMMGISYSSSRVAVGCRGQPVYFQTRGRKNPSQRQDTAYARVPFQGKVWPPGAGCKIVPSHWGLIRSIVLMVLCLPRVQTGGIKSHYLY